MIQYIKRIAAGLALVAICTTASGERLIAELNGSGNQTTATFTLRMFYPSGFQRRNHRGAHFFRPNSAYRRV